MKYTKEQLSHIEKMLNPRHFPPSDEKDLQLDVSYHKVDGVEMAKIHIATKEEVEYSKWEDFLISVEEKIKKEEKKSYIALNAGSILTVIFFIPMCILFFLLKDKLQVEKEIVYICLASFPLFWYVLIGKIQKNINGRVYKKVKEKIETELSCL